MSLPDPGPVLRRFAIKWGVPLADITGRCREKRVVYARAEAARELDAMGYNVKWLQHLLNRDRTTILYYLGTSAQRLIIPSGSEMDQSRVIRHRMPDKKLNEAQRAELVRLYEAGDIRGAARLARSWNVSPYYGCMLKNRAKRAKDRKWARARAMGPINPEGAET